MLASVTTLPAAKPHYSAFYQLLWSRYLEMQEGTRKTFNELAEYEEREFQEESWNRVFTRIDREVDKNLSDTATELIGKLVRFAEREFAPDGGSLTIDAAPYKEIVGRVCCDQARWSDINLVNLWSEIEKDFGGEKGEAEGYKQAAREIVSAFSLERRPELKESGGRIVLNVSAYSEVNYRKERTLTFYGEECVNKALRSLRTLAMWCNDGETATYIRARVQFGDLRRHQISTRETFRVSPAVHIVTFHDKWEFRVSREFARSLQVFLATYGSAAP